MFKSCYSKVDRYLPHGTLLLISRRVSRGNHCCSVNPPAAWAFRRLFSTPAFFWHEKHKKNEETRMSTTSSSSVKDNGPAPKLQLHAATQSGLCDSKQLTHGSYPK
uniref:Uncharacterized protein n=1 Tax=Entomoneis paludosa TaxID=265537 RepID=A0A7S3DWU2_9STRA